MVEQEVTIALKLDTAQFNRGLAGVQKQLQQMSSLNMSPGIKASGLSGGSSGHRSVASSVITLTKSTDKLSKSSNNIERSVAFMTSMFRGNMSSFNILGLGKALGGLGSRGGSSSKQSLDPLSGLSNVSFAKPEVDPLSGIESIGGGESAAAAGSASADAMGVFLEILGGIITIVLVVSGLVVVMETIMVTIKPVLTVLKAIGKILAVALMPISLFIVEMLKPVMIMLIPIVKAFSALLMPLRRSLAEKTKEDIGRIKELSKKVASGDTHASFELIALQAENVLGVLFDYFIKGFASVAIDLSFVMNAVILNALRITTINLGDILIDLLGAALGLPPEFTQGLKDGLRDAVNPAFDGIINDLEPAADKLKVMFGLVGDTISTTTDGILTDIEKLKRSQTDRWTSQVEKGFPVATTKIGNQLPTRVDQEGLDIITGRNNKDIVMNGMDTSPISVSQEESGTPGVVNLYMTIEGNVDSDNIDKITYAVEQRVIGKALTLAKLG